MLTDAKVRAAEPGEKVIRLWDERGLYLELTPAGGRWWRFKYRLHGKEKRISLGTYPDVPLKRAREKRDEARRLVADGKDPSVERQRAKKASRDTLRQVAEDWLTEGPGAGRSERTLKKTRWLLQLLDPLMGRPVGLLEAQDVLPVLKAIEGRGNRETAHRARQLVSQLMRFAVSSGRAKHDVTADLRGALLPIEQESHPAITDPAQVGKLMQDIAVYDGKPSTVAALRLAPLVILRSGELRGGVWGELVSGEAFGVEGTLWAVPGPRMKGKLPHLVPLPKQAVAIFDWLRPLTYRGPDSLMFPGERSLERCISNSTLNAALRRLGYSSDELVHHGFRSTFSTLANERHMARADVIEMQIAHIDDSVRGIYNRALYLAERVTLMQAWADLLDKLRTESRKNS